MPEPENHDTTEIEPIDFSAEFARAQGRRDRQYDHGPAWHEPEVSETDAERLQRIADEIDEYGKGHNTKLPALPDYVEPREGVPDVGVLSAHVLVQDFENTAKGIEEMSKELTATAHQSAKELTLLATNFKSMSEEINKVVDHVKETAELYRQEAKAVFQRIEETTLRMQEVRNLSTTMRERLIATKAGLQQEPLAETKEAEAQTE